MSHRSCSRARATSSVSSAREKTSPVGLCGVLTSRACVRGVMAARTAARSRDQPASGSRRSGTGTARAPASSACGTYTSYTGSNTTSSAGCPSLVGTSSDSASVSSPSVAPLVTMTSAGSTFRSAPSASRRAGRPSGGVYWSTVPTARRAASSRKAGGGFDGKPWPRFTAPCRAASRLMWVKMLVWAWRARGCNSGMGAVWAPRRSKESGGPDKSCRRLPPVCRCPGGLPL